MKSAFLAILILLTPHLSFADDQRASLFLAAEDEAKAVSLAKKLSPTGTGDITLGALMYYDENDWSLWLRGEMWTPETKRDDLSVINVAPDFAVIAWQDPVTGQRIGFKLSPNQSYQITTGKIIEQR